MICICLSRTHGHDGHRSITILRALRLLYVPWLSSTCPLSLLYVSSLSLLMRAWTTDDEYLWLKARFPGWRTKHKGFVKEVTGEFLKAFPANKSHGSKLEGVSTCSFFLPT